VHNAHIHGETEREREPARAAEASVAIDFRTKPKTLGVAEQVYMQKSQPPLSDTEEKKLEVGSFEPFQATATLVNKHFRLGSMLG